MATRFRKLRTHKTKSRKALKTRKHGGKLNVSNLKRMLGNATSAVKGTVRKMTNKVGVTESNVDKMFREEEEKIQAMKNKKNMPMNFGYEINRTQGTVKKV